MFLKSLVLSCLLVVPGLAAAQTTPEAEAAGALEQSGDEKASADDTVADEAVAPIEEAAEDGASAATDEAAAATDEAAAASDEAAAASETASHSAVEDKQEPVEDSEVATDDDPAGGVQAEEELLPPQGTGDVLAPEKSKMPLSDFVDTRMSFSFSDDDFFAGPGDTRPNSPSLDFAPRRSNKVFFDNLNSRDTGQETLTHLVLYRHLPGFIPGVDTEAALVMRFNLYADDETGQRKQSFYDDGTYLKLGWYPGKEIDEDNLHFTLTMFPFDTNRFRLGYLYDISWGGPEIFPSSGVSAPGAKLQMDVGPFYMYGGAKTARLLDENINEIESNWGFLGGLGIDMMDMFTLETGAGYFTRGTNPLTGVEGEPVLGYGGSGRPWRRNWLCRTNRYPEKAHSDDQGAKQDRDYRNADDGVDDSEPDSDTGRSFRRRERCHRWD